jgi:hypothetical protein
MISCICCHYGRTWLLAEAIQSYLRQDFDEPSELLVINDHPNINIYQHEDISNRLKPGQEVRFINWGARFATLSHKFDYGVTLAKYPLICMWDDDDLSLPNRLAYSYAEWQLEGKPHYLSFGRHFYCDQRGPHLVARGLHGGDIMTAWAYWQCGGSTGDGHNDQNLVAEMKRREYYHQLDDCLPTYLYRWSFVGSHHSIRLGVEDAMQTFDEQVRQNVAYREGDLTIWPSFSIQTQALWQQCEKLQAQEGRRLCPISDGGAPRVGTSER